MKTHLKVYVDPNELGLPGNRHHCAIANAIMLAEPDIVLVRVDEFNIRYSRRSTGARFEFVTPSNAVDFIHEFDKLVAAPSGGGKVRKMTAKPFTLTLTDHHLLREVPRRARSATYAIQRAAVKAFGPIVVSPAAKAATGRTAASGATPAPPAPAAAPRKRTNPAPRKRPSVRAS